MKQLWLLITLTSLACSAAAQGKEAQSKIYRCGNEYTNTKPSSDTKGCKLIEGGNITIIRSIPVPKANTNSTSANKVEPAQQSARDSDSRMILQEELKRALAHRQQLQQEYNNGAPDKLGAETRNYQKYLDRVAAMKADIDRNESDIAGLQRELQRLDSANAPR